MSQFITIVQPLGQSVRQYPTDDIGSTPPASISAGFRDCMIVRKAVFIEEQGCRLANEIDTDDERAFYWVAYASIGAPKSSSPALKEPGNERSEYQRRKSIGGQVPVSVLRLVPPPHGNHPAPGSVDGVGGEEVETVYNGDRKTSFHDGREIYVKIGRMATVKDFRGFGLGKLLMNHALDWARANKKTLSLIPQDGAERERAQQELGEKFGELEWKGLVLVHSQVSAIRFYRQFGFVEDEELGIWIEEGIEHVAMWKRMKV
ncbi:MAG: hypothetical protein LQ340_005329 [Diploschistes diacapsis]|nr:MAG: hypothetical protein LQ340_005329 [Diploschistes diacapsis]